MNELAILERRVERGLKSFRQAGQALKRIRDGRLYREAHSTWEAYCRGRWGISHRYADRLVGASEVGQDLGPIGPRNEGQARELLRLPKRFRRPILESLQRTGVTTAGQIREARNAIAALSPEQKFRMAATAEQQAVVALDKLYREHVVEKIERMCGRLRELHSDLDVKEQADEALTHYQEVIRAAA